VAEDLVIVEEPLEIRVAGDTLAVTMRTPGHDRELALGFLWAEGIVRALDEVGGVAHCNRGDDEDGRGNTIEVTPAPGARLCLPDGEAGRRGTLMSSACGVCGRRSIDDLLARCVPVAEGGRLLRRVLLSAVAALRPTQRLFAATGGCHGAALFQLGGEHLATFEDVGRHNAVDKLIGSRLLAGALPAHDQLLVVSGRTSFEIVQKAVMAGIPFVAGISAPSSLAIEVAARAGVTLIGFVRGDEFVVYSGAGRVEG
jgi:FdhD protein